MKKQVLLTLVVGMCLVSILTLPFMAACAPEAPAVEPIVLGCPLSIGFPDGVSAERNIRLAVDEINAQGGVNVAGVMHPFKVEVMDTRGLEPGVPTSEALLVVEKLILDKEVDFLIGGPIRSEAALAAMDLVSKYKTVSIISAGVLTPAYHAKVAEEYDKYKYCFRTTGNVVPMIGESVSILESLKETYGFNKVFIMVQDVAHAVAAGNAIKGGLEEKGWNILGYEKYPTGSSDFSVGLLKARDEGAQVLFLWFDMPEGSILLKQWHDMQLSALPCGFVVAAHDSAFWEAVEGKCAYLVNSYCKAGIAPTDAIPLAEKYIELYRGEFGVDPGLTWVAPVSYQVVYILKDAIERAGSIDSDAVIAALEETDMMGVYGRIKFDPQSHQIVYSMDPAEGAVGCWAQWLDGNRVVVYPPEAATAPIALPPWMK